MSRCAMGKTRHNQQGAALIIALLLVTLLGILVAELSHSVNVDSRAALNAGDWPEALTIYETLVSSSEMLDEVIENLETGVQQNPDDAAGFQLLGDARMKDGRLQDALQAYRTALGKL